LILEGKTISFLGDSITEGVGVVDIPNNRYDHRLKSMTGLAKVYNHGIGGSRLAHQRHASVNPKFDLCFCGRVHLLEPTADIIVVYGGVNDYLHGDAPIGQVGDTTPDTFCGAVDYLMRFLKENYSGQSVFIAPAKCYLEVLYTEVSTRPSKLPDALPLRGYVEILAQTANRYSIPFLNLFKDLPYDPAAHPEQMMQLTKEGLHFNDEGHKLLAETLCSFLLSL